jgi:PAS domain S-box-containing protein
MEDPQAEAARPEGQLLYGAFRASPIGIALEDLEGRPFFVNPALCSMLGFSEEEMRSKHCVEFSPAEDAKKDWALFEQLRAGAIDHYQIEKRFFRRDGSLIWGRLSISLSKDSASPLVVAMVEDITEKRAALFAVRESEERFRLVANNVPVMIWMSGPDKRCTYVNQRWLEFTGRSSEAELASDWAAGIHPEDFEGALEAYTRAFDRREPFQIEYRLHRKDGEYRWVFDHAVPRFNEDGSFAGYIGSTIDVMERKRVENERRLAEDKLQEYERTVEGLEEMIAVIDREYRYLIANNRFVRIRNMTKEQVVGHFAYEVLNKRVFEDVVKEKVDECFQGKVVRYEMKYTYPELGERDVFVSYFPIEGATTVDRVACIVQDITERKRAEEALSTVSQRLIEAHEEERTRIARELHDDINQRVGLVAAYLDQWKQSLLAVAPELAQQIEETRDEVEHLGSDIQTLSHRLHSPKLELLGLAATAASLCREVSDRQGVQIDFDTENIPKDVPEEISLCLFRVLQEALQNATKHSGSRHFQVLLLGRSNEVELTVHDSGIGFEPEEAIKGTGLGLTSMKERLKLVDGKLSIDSKPQHGTTIRARVPLSSKTRSAGVIG